MLKLLDLFTGIGGFSMAAQWTGEIETIAFCEIEPFCQKVLKKHWPDVPIFSDIKELRGDDVGTVDILTGGFPCQPFSCAGKQRGKDDDRYLWPEMFRIIQETKPTWVVGENVPGLIDMALEDCFLDMEAEGYEVQPLIIPACGVNAPHKRDRVWILAHSGNAGLQRSKQPATHIERVGTERTGPFRAVSQCSKIVANSCDITDIQTHQAACSLGSERNTRDNVNCGGGRTKPGVYWWDAEPGMGRVAHGLSGKMDRLKALGNSIVPQVVYPILQGIVDIEKEAV